MKKNKHIGHDVFVSSTDEQQTLGKSRVEDVRGNAITPFEIRLREAQRARGKKRLAKGKRKQERRQMREIMAQHNFKMVGGGKQ